MFYTVVTTVVLLACALFGALLSGPLNRATRKPQPLLPTPEQVGGVGIGTVRTISDTITIDVESISGQRFVGRLRPQGDDTVLTELHAGVVLLVTFDPTAREQLSLADDMVAVRSEFDQMFLRKGLVTREELALIRTGTKSRGIVTAMTATGAEREDYREVELDLMVRRPGGGQFPAHETTLVPASALSRLTPGALIDAYYRSGDESSVAVCVPPR